MKTLSHENFSGSGNQTLFLFQYFHKFYANTAALRGNLYSTRILIILSKVFRKKIQQIFQLTTTMRIYLFFYNLQLQK